MRILGAILILGSGLSLGLCCGEVCRKKLLCLSSLCSALEMFRAELSTSLLPLPELCRIIKERAEAQGAELFSAVNDSLTKLGEEDFSSLWEKAVREIADELRADDLNAVLALGGILGRYELSEQLSALDNVILQLRTSLFQERRTYPEQKKLGLGLSAAGAMIILLTLI